ncbi:hypothetical protein VU01_12644, partial [Candidatus Electrothrix marina]
AEMSAVAATNIAETSGGAAMNIAETVVTPIMTDMNTEADD